MRTNISEKKIEIELVNGEKVMKVSLQSPNQHDIIALLSNAFTFLDAELNLDKIETTYDKISNLYANFYEVHKIGEATENNESISISEISEKVKDEEIILNSLDFIKEVDGETDEERSKRLYNLGIKERNGTPTFRAKYKCSRCGEDGRHYVFSIRSKAYCHHCDNALKLDFASPDSTDNKLIPDKDFNYFKGA